MDEQKEKQNAKKKRSTLPIYAIGAVWLLYAKKLDSFRGILSCAVVSLIVYAILRIVMRGKKSEEPPKTAAPEQPQPKQEEKKPEPQPQSESDEKLPPELQSVIYQGKRAIADIRRLNDEIPDERMSAQIDLIERLTAQIFDCVRQHPEKLSQIRQFLNYYLPTTIKLMEQYVTLQNQNVKTENITEGMQKIEDLLDKVIVAFQRQLDALFESDVVDITADIRVMEQMMASEGLTNKKDFAYPDFLQIQEEQTMDEYIPQLTLTPDLNAQPQPKVKKEEDLITKAQAAPEAGPDLSALSAQEQQAVLAFSKQIDLENAQQILEYGASAQKNIADFSDTALAKVKTGDLGEIGTMLSGLLVELKTMDEPEKKGIAGLFRKAKINAEEMKSRFATAEVNVDRISGELEKHKVTLLKDVAVMDQMYERNLQYFKELTMYILAGKQKLAEARNTTLRQLREKAEASNLPEDAQAANDFENKCVRFEKKLHDLELTRMISLQTAPQIRMIQNNDTALVEKIQTSVLNTIPLWKNQMVLTLGIENSRRAMEAQRQVTDMTNALLQKNADMLHMASVETAKESERGIVDMETLNHTNEQLISTLDEVLQIQTDGAKKRQEAEAELRRLEGELKQKLLQPRS